MRNRRMLLQLLFSMALVLSLIVSASLLNTASVMAQGQPQYELTISSTAGGSVTTPGQGTFIYDEGTVVDLVAEPKEGYRFVNWSGDVDTIADVNAASTIITMDDDLSVTANFEEIPLSLVNWPLIGGIIAAVVAAGLVIFFVRRKRAAQTKES